MSCTRKDILAELVTIGQPIGSKSIADRLGKPYYTVSALLSKLYFRGEIGRMTLPDYRRGRAYLYYAKGKPATIAGCIVGACLSLEQTRPKQDAPHVALDEQRGIADLI
jgi:predicted transcriptional regulator